jgi:hypothetical protein
MDLVLVIDHELHCFDIANIVSLFFDWYAATYLGKASLPFTCTYQLT